ncbi:ATP-binding cassette domain-containing protein [Jiella sp. MQZ9-1]|uniref:ATP-binding cassette domain-containing protein n=1 Tax=Jiella flava TaxID=2816857 RepID=A0A939FZX0_9HYPH|nr:oligopeptide/dipeptide ABC transporter ATP-binding protein [Jiella flava]MBO0663058.1 ATP-binding cassette domain-containing protein [Jiella flava]MCD2471477.1 ATP-binding cassette domain-containing protein [Jiella flava]
MTAVSDARLLEVRDLSRRFGGGRTLFGVKKPQLTAVGALSLDLQKGETLGIVGESGCGKSTLARLLVGLDRPSAGTIRLDGEDLAAAGRRAVAAKVQYVFQDPVSSLNPRHTIRAILEAPMRHLLGLGKAERARRLDQLIEDVNLRPEFLERYPHEFSGGQAQRIGIARALAADPDVVVLDEPVSALDVSVQAQVLNLLERLKRERGLTYVFISHDLAVVESVSTRVAVMYFGALVETAPARAIFAAPRHPYTRLLIDSAQIPGRQRAPKSGGSGELPDPYNPPPGCAFAPRCSRAEEICGEAMPGLEARSGDSQHHVACFNPIPLAAHS